MASRKQQSLDEKAKALGFRNYYDLRDSKAKELGFRSYSDLRRHRRDLKFNGQKAQEWAQRIRREEALKPKSGFTPADLAGKRNIIPNNGARLRLSFAQLEEMLRENASLAAVTGDLNEGRLGITDRRLDSSLDDIRRYFDEDLVDFGEAAGRAVNPDFKMGRSERKFVDDIADEAKKKLTAANRFAKKDSKRLIKKIAGFSDRDAAKTLADKNPIRAVVYANGTRHSLVHYSDLVTRASVSRTANGMQLAAMRQMDVEVVEVSDGADCGWTSHDDPDKANGKLVAVEEAESHLIAHPNCRRSFRPRPDIDKGNLYPGRRVAQAVSRAVTGAAVATARAEARAVVKHLFTDAVVRQAASNVAREAVVEFLQFKQKITNLVRLYEHERTAGTGLAVIGSEGFVAQPASFKKILDDVWAYAQDFTEGKEVPEHVANILGVQPQVARKAQQSVELRKVVGDKFDNFMEFRSRQQESVMSISDFVDYNEFKALLQDEFLDWLGPILPENRFVRYSFPKIGGRGGFERGQRLTLKIGDLAKVSRTSLKGRGVVNNLSLNPNGLLRASFSRNPETGFWTPSFRIIPHGPLHIMTRVNRGVQGNITSLSTEVRLLTRLPIFNTVGFNTNINLRKLGLESLQEIRNLRLADFLKLGREDIRGVSAAARARVFGNSLFELSKTFRMQWEDARKLYDLSVHELGSHLADLKAQARRAKFFVVDSAEDSLLEQAASGKLINPHGDLSSWDLDQWEKGLFTDAEHTGNEDLDSLIDAVWEWSRDFHVVRSVRDEISNGEVSTAVAEKMADILSHARPTDRKIFRGMTLHKNDPILKSSVGDHIKFGISSFSEDEALAEEFLTLSRDELETFLARADDENFKEVFGSGRLTMEELRDEGSLDPVIESALQDYIDFFDKSLSEQLAEYAPVTIEVEAGEASAFPLKTLLEANHPAWSEWVSAGEFEVVETSHDPILGYRIKIKRAFPDSFNDPSATVFSGGLREVPNPFPPMFNGGSAGLEDAAAIEEINAIEILKDFLGITDVQKVVRTLRRPAQLQSLESLQRSIKAEQTARRVFGFGNLLDKAKEDLLMAQQARDIIAAKAAAKKRRDLLRRLRNEAISRLGTELGHGTEAQRIIRLSRILKIKEDI